MSSPSCGLYIELAMVVASETVEFYLLQEITAAQPFIIKNLKKKFWRQKNNFNTLEVPLKAYDIVDECKIKAYAKAIY